MKKLNTTPISGTQELLPGEQAIFDGLKIKIQETFRRHGFLNIETPMLERAEILLAKAGGDTEKQIYKVLKTGENEMTASEADQALRFDHTVPLARYVVEHENDLAFPFKVAQTGENFRGERAQKGRFREFYQCDVDVIGRGELPLFYDADVIATLLDAYQSFGLNTPVVARISNRKILQGFLEGLNLQEKTAEISSIIDHSEKVSPEKTVAALEEIGLDEAQKERILWLMGVNGDRETVIDALLGSGVDNDLMREGIAELGTCLKTLEIDAYQGSVKADLRIIRGLDYYTGMVWEFALPEHPEIGSVGGGGRYDNLTEYFSDQKFPGVGGSIGLNRLFFILREEKLLPDSVSEKPIDYAVVPISENETEYALGVARELRGQGAAVMVMANDKKLGTCLKNAARVAKNAIIIGEEEAKSGSYEIKSLK